MFWHDSLYLGKNCIRRANRLKYKITNRLAHGTVYLITLPTGPHTLLEMVPSSLLLQEVYPRETLTVVGMGASRREGMELMRRILQDVYRERQDFNVAEYFNTMGEKE